MKDKEEIKELATNFRETADILDKLVVLAEREDAGEDIKAESESLLGQFMIKMMKINGKGIL